MVQKAKKERTWKFWLLIIIDIAVFVEGLSNTFEGFSEKAWLKMSLGMIMVLLSLYIFTKSIEN